jgi:hypothetical protein
MNEDAAPSAPKLRPDAEGGVGDTRLLGWRLLVARVVAFSVINVTMLLGIVALCHSPPPQ